MSKKTNTIEELFSMAKNYFSNNKSDSKKESTQSTRRNPRMVSIKKVEPKLVSIQDKKEYEQELKSKLTPIKPKDGKAKVISTQGDKVTMADKNGNRFTYNMTKKMKSNNWKLEQLNDGIATITYDNGDYEHLKRN